VFSPLLSWVFIRCYEHFHVQIFKIRTWWRSLSLCKLGNVSRSRARGKVFHLQRGLQEAHLPYERPQRTATSHLKFFSHFFPLHFFYGYLAVNGIMYNRRICPANCASLSTGASWLSILLKVLSSENYGRSQVVSINSYCFSVVVLDIIF
jgi:hypothetical protein